MIRAHFAMGNAIKTTELARHLAEKVRRNYRAQADSDRLLLVASVTEENRSQMIAVEGNVLEPYQQAANLRHALNTLRPS